MSAPMKVSEIDHVVFRCNDRELALDFYTRVLGLVEERRIESIGLIQLRAGRSMIDLVPAAPECTGGGRNVDHLCLAIETDDLNRVADYLRRNSVEVMGEPVARYGARGTALSIYVRDPEGNVLELKQVAPSD